MGSYRLARGKSAFTGIGALEGAIFGLMGLMIAFTFSGAASRWETRRYQIIEETNAIGTAYLRIDLLPPHLQPRVRNAFRLYLDTRIATYKTIPVNLKEAYAMIDRSNEMQKEIWTMSVRAVRESGSQAAAMLFLPALNQMIDITTTRTVAAQIHPPSIIFVILILLALVCSLLAGYSTAGNKTRSWIYFLVFAMILTFTIYLILDLEYPRLGLVRIDAADSALIELRNGMK
jgi:hypothetical protein